MKLKSSLPERPGWLFVTPGFDLMLLLLAFVTLTRVVGRDSFVEVEIPPSEFRGQRLSEEEWVVVSVTQGQVGPIFYVGRERFDQDSLETAVALAAAERGTELVVARFDKRVELAVEQELMDLCARLELDYWRAVRTKEVTGR